MGVGFGEPFLRPGDQRLGQRQILKRAAQNDRVVPRNVDVPHRGHQQGIGFPASGRAPEERFLVVQVDELSLAIRRDVGAIPEERLN